MNLEYLLFSNDKTCQPCIRLKEHLKTNYPDFKYETVNPFEDERAIKYRVRSTPTLITLKDGEVVDCVIGFTTQESKLDIEKLVFKQLKV